MGEYAREMGQTWGINRTMAEIHAFLYVTGKPQNTDDVMDRLNISRGNASMSLRALGSCHDDDPGYML